MVLGWVVMASQGKLHWQKALGRLVGAWTSCCPASDHSQQVILAQQVREGTFWPWQQVKMVFVVFFSPLKN